ncbi:unnamed protein product [Moneuplotes crassus]|uniref:Uncharacterized protein n=1 Tax=Euplotes crassus TaxID=5936 RepID=A0AAD1XXZ8_EUPCR|nr:unnamed protein product [Moneuplotes crassus]
MKRLFPECMPSCLLSNLFNPDWIPCLYLLGCSNFLPTSCSSGQELRNFSLFWMPEHSHCPSL